MASLTALPPGMGFSVEFPYLTLHYAFIIMGALFLLSALLFVKLIRKGKRPSEFSPYEGMLQEEKKLLSGAEAEVKALERFDQKLAGASASENRKTLNEGREKRE
ncbi:MAG: hypothetical protein JW727_06055 [Candidatus Aenigmarchaeota archaeon]|nr:hypothetical protein [Candidatus Aenigmarchaeota archaeon]